MAQPITIHPKHPTAPDSEQASVTGCAKGGLEAGGEGVAAFIDFSAQFVWLSL